MEQVSVIGIGNPLLDIQVNADDALLQEYELKKETAILAEEKHKSLYERIFPNALIIPGGATLNAIRVANWFLNGRKKVGYLGSIGKDTYGQKLVESLNKENCKHQFYKTPSTPTGTCAVLINQGRTLVANLASAIEFPFSHFQANEEYFANAEICYFSCFFLTSCAEAAIALAKNCTAWDKPFGINLGAEFLIEFNKDQMLQCLEHAMFVFGNETEALKFSQVHNLGTTNQKEIARKIAQMSFAPKQKSPERKRYVILTQGKNPTILSDGENEKEYPIVPIEPQKIRDTNGAGDAFVGGFLGQYSLTKDLESSIKAAQYAAWEIIQRDGCSLPEYPPNF